MGQAKLYGQNKGGMSINGIIKDYYAYAGENISAGDLVEYINGVAGKTDYGESVDTQISTEAHAGTSISAVALDNNRVFVVHPYGSNYHLYGVVVIVNGASIVVGEPTVLSTSSYAGYQISTCLLRNGNVFIAHSYSSNYEIYGMVVSINDLEIEIGSDTQMVASTNSSAFYRMSVCTLPDGNVFMAYRNGSYAYLYGMVLTISDKTITLSSSTQLSTSKLSGNAISTCLLQNGNIFIAHSYGNTYYLAGIVVSISGTTITKGSDTVLYQADYSGGVVSTCLLPDGEIFIVHKYTSNSQLYGRLVSIDGNNIIVVTSLILSTTNNTSTYISSHLLPNGDIFIAHSNGAATHLSGMIVSIKNDEIIVLTDSALISKQNAGFAECVLLKNGTIFIAHIVNISSNNYPFAQIFGIDYDNNIPTNNISITEYETQVRQVTTGQFDGVAKTSGEGSPEYVEGEVKKTGNIFPISGWNEEVAYTKYSANGYVIEADSAYSNQYPVKNAFDNSTSGNSYWRPVQGATGSIQITCPEPIKITKMKTFVCDDYSGSYFDNAVIQGKVTDGEWVDLYTISTNQTSLTEITLNNTDLYNDYKMTVTIQSSAREIRVPEWQTSEYIEKGLVPSTGHNDLVSIWTKPEEVVYTGNIFPTNWNEEITGTKYSSNEGYTLTTNGTNMSPTKKLSELCDEDISTIWQPLKQENNWVKMDCPKPTKITKMKTYFGGTYFLSANIKGSKDNSEWVSLYTISSSQSTLTEIKLENPDYYKYYQIDIVHSDSSQTVNMREWQTSEYIVLE